MLPFVLFKSFYRCLLIAAVLLPCYSFGKDTPEWFHNLPAGEDEIIGYGSGECEDRAQVNARYSIAQELQSLVSGMLSATTREHDDTLHTTFESKKKSFSEVILYGSTVVKSEKMKKVWYCAVRYDNTPPELKMIRELKKQSCYESGQNSYLKVTPLVQTINNALSCNYTINLMRKNGLWCLSHNALVVPLTDNAFFKLMVPVSSSKIRIVPAKSELVEGDPFSFTITSREDGFVTLIGVGQNGTSFRYCNNHAIKNGEQFSFPYDKTDKMVAAVSSKQAAERDLYFAILSKRELQTGRISQIGNQVRQDEWDHTFDEVIDLLNENEFCSVLLRTEPARKPQKSDNE